MSVRGLEEFGEIGRWRLSPRRRGWGWGYETSVTSDDRHRGYLLLFVVVVLEDRDRSSQRNDRGGRD